MAVELKFSKFDNAPWGFRLTGGGDCGMPLTVVQVTEGGSAHAAGLREGDALLQLQGESLQDVPHDEAHARLREAGNNFALDVLRSDGGRGGEHSAAAALPKVPSPACLVSLLPSAARTVPALERPLLLSPAHRDDFESVPQEAWREMASQLAWTADAGREKRLVVSPRPRATPSPVLEPSHERNSHLKVKGNADSDTATDNSMDDLETRTIFNTEQNRKTSTRKAEYKSNLNTLGDKGYRAFSPNIELMVPKLESPLILSPSRWDRFACLDASAGTSLSESGFNDTNEILNSNIDFAANCDGKKGSSLITSPLVDPFKSLDSFQTIERREWKETASKLEIQKKISSGGKISSVMRQSADIAEQLSTTELTSRIMKEEQPLAVQNGKCEVNGDIDIDEIETSAKTTVNENLEKAIVMIQDCQNENDLASITPEKVMWYKATVKVEERSLGNLKEAEEVTQSSTKCENNDVVILDETVQEKVANIEKNSANTEKNVTEYKIHEDKIFTNVQNDNTAISKEIKKSYESENKNIDVESSAIKKVLNIDKNIKDVKLSTESQRHVQQSLNVDCGLDEAKINAMNAATVLSQQAKQCNSKVPCVIANISTVSSTDMLLKTFFIHLTDVMVALTQTIMNGDSKYCSSSCSPQCLCQATGLCKKMEQLQTDKAMEETCQKMAQSVQGYSTKEVKIANQSYKNENHDTQKKTTEENIILQDQMEKPPDEPMAQKVLFEKDSLETEKVLQEVQNALGLDVTVNGKDPLEWLADIDQMKKLNIQKDVSECLEIDNREREGLITKTTANIQEETVLTKAVETHRKVFDSESCSQSFVEKSSSRISESAIALDMTQLNAACKTNKQHMIENKPSNGEIPSQIITFVPKKNQGEITKDPQTPNTDEFMFRLDIKLGTAKEKPPYMKQPSLHEDLTIVKRPGLAIGKMTAHISDINEDSDSSRNFKLNDIRDSEVDEKQSHTEAMGNLQEINSNKEISMQKLAVIKDDNNLIQNISVTSSETSQISKENENLNNLIQQISTSNSTNSIEFNQQQIHTQKAKEALERHSLEYTIKTPPRRHSGNVSTDGTSSPRNESDEITSIVEQTSEFTVKSPPRRQSTEVSVDYSQRHTTQENVTSEFTIKSPPRRQSEEITIEERNLPGNNIEEIKTVVSESSSILKENRQTNLSSESEEKNTQETSISKFILKSPLRRQSGETTTEQKSPSTKESVEERSPLNVALDANRESLKSVVSQQNVVAMSSNLVSSEISETLSSLPPTHATAACPASAPVSPRESFPNGVMQTEESQKTQEILASIDSTPRMAAKETRSISPQVNGMASDDMSIESAAEVKTMEVATQNFASVESRRFSSATNLKGMIGIAQEQREFQPEEIHDKPGLTDMEVCEIVQGHPDISKEEHVQGLQKVLAAHMNQPQQEEEYTGDKPTIEFLRHSEVFKLLNEENIKRHAEKIREQQKYTKFLQKPNRPVPFCKRLHGDPSLPEEPYRVNIKKQPKKEPNVFSPSILTEGVFLIPEVPILIPEPAPQILEAPEYLADSSFPDLEDTGIPIPPEPIEELIIEDKKIEELGNGCETETMEEEKNNKEQIQPEEEWKEAVIVDDVTDADLPVEEQLLKVQRQLEALSKLPAAIQQTLDLVTKQLGKMVPAPQQQEAPQEISQEQQNGDIVSVKNEINGDVKESGDESAPTENMMPLENGIDHADPEHEAHVIETKEVPVENGETTVFTDQENKIQEERKIQKMKQEVMDELAYEHATRQIKQRPTRPRACPAFGPLTPSPRALVLPGGRRWRGPKDAFNDAFIAETLSAQSSVITGTTIGKLYDGIYDSSDNSVNFKKFEKPPITLQHLKDSPVYRLVHDMEDEPHGLQARRGTLLAECEYREKCRSVTPLPMIQQNGTSNTMAICTDS